MFKLHIKGEDRLYGALNRLAERVSDFRRHWQPNIDIRLRHQRDWLDTRGDGTWPKLTDTYLERKSHDPKAAFVEILQLTGHLYRSLTQEKAADAVVEEGKSSLIMGTSDPLGRIHHEGKGRVPVRRVISIEDDEIREHKEALYESVADVARAEAFAVVN